MTYTVLAVRTADETDGTLYPIMGADEWPVELEELDKNPIGLKAAALALKQSVDGRVTKLGTLLDVKIDVVITDSRVALACSDWDKGDRYWGVGLGATTALVDNMISKAKAARRRRGKMLLGHVRYQWLHYVGYFPKAGWRHRPQLRLCVGERLAGGSIRSVILDLGLDKSVDSVETGRSIAQRAANHWLTHMGVQDPSALKRLQELAAGLTLPPPGPKTFANYLMPQYQLVGVDTALPPRGSGLAPAATPAKPGHAFRLPAGGQGSHVSTTPVDRPDSRRRSESS